MAKESPRFDRFNRRHFFKLVGGTLASLGLGSLVEGCGPSSTEEQRRILEKRGILGEHELLNLSSLKETHPKGETLVSIQFAWQPNTEEKETIITKLPIDKVIFLPDEEKTIPTVEFHFDMYTLTCVGPGLFCVPEDYSNANDWFSEENIEALEKAVIRLTPDQFQELLSGTLESK